MCHNFDPHAPSPMLDAIPAFVMAPEVCAARESFSPSQHVFLSSTDDHATLGGVPNHYAATRAALQRACADLFSVRHQFTGAIPIGSAFKDPDVQIFVCVIDVPSQPHIGNVPSPWIISPPSGSTDGLGEIPNITSGRQQFEALRTLAAQHHDLDFKLIDCDNCLYLHSRPADCGSARQLSGVRHASFRVGKPTPWPGLRPLKYGNPIPPESHAKIYQTEPGMHSDAPQGRPNRTITRKLLKSSSISMLAHWLSSKQHASISCAHVFRRLYIDIVQSRQRIVILKFSIIDRLLSRNFSGCVMQNQEKSKSIARPTGLRLIGGRADIENAGNGLAMRRKPARRRLQKRSENDRSPRRTGRREHEPGLPESVLNAPGGPIAALLRSGPGATGGRSFAENFAAFSEDQVPCLALARSERPDVIRATLPEPATAATSTVVKTVLH